MGKLTDLNLSYNSLNILVKLILHESFGLASKSLKNLSLSECSIDESLSGYMISRLKSLINLESLDLSFNDFSKAENDFITKVVSGCPLL